MDTIRAVLIPVGREPRVVELDSDNSTHEMQNYVGGLFDCYSNFRYLGIDMWVNDTGLLDGLTPNRAIFATKTLEENQLLNQFSNYSLVKENELIDILVGDIICTSFNEMGETVSLSDKQVDFLKDEFKDPDTGIAAVEAFRLFQGIGETDAPMRKDVELISGILKEIRENDFEEMKMNPDLGDTHPELEPDIPDNEYKNQSLSDKDNAVSKAQAYKESERGDVGSHTTPTGLDDR